MGMKKQFTSLLIFNLFKKSFFTPYFLALSSMYLLHFVKTITTFMYVFP